MHSKTLCPCRNIMRRTMFFGDAFFLRTPLLRVPIATYYLIEGIWNFIECPTNSWINGCGKRVWVHWGYPKWRYWLQFWWCQYGQEKHLDTSLKCIKPEQAFRMGKIDLGVHKQIGYIPPLLMKWVSCCYCIWVLIWGRKVWRLLWGVSYQIDGGGLLLISPLPLFLT